MKERKDYEDIISDSSLSSNDFVDISSVSGDKKGKHFVKKKRGIAGLFQKIAIGWKSLGVGAKATVIVCTAIVVAVSIAAGVIFSTFDYNYNSITKKPEDLGFQGVIDKNVVNIALFGIDSRSEGFRGNSDSIMVLSLNTKTKQIKIVSIVRDTLVKIERNGKIKYSKINSAYGGKGGGPELAIKTLNQNFGLDISEYATVNFDGMAQIIDAVGGIDVELVAGEVVPASQNKYLFNALIADICSRTGDNPEKYYIHKAGKYHLNGVQAVAYSRIRKTKNVWGTNNDYGRTDRQRYVMEQLFNKALTMKKSEYMKLAKALMPCTETSLSYTEIISLAADILLKSPTFSQSRVPLSDYQMKGISLKGVGDCVYYDLNYAAKVLHAYFYEDITPEDYIKQNGVEKNDWYRQEVGSSSIQAPSSTPDTSEPTNSEPDVTEPTESQPDGTVSDTLQTESNKPDISEPDDTQTESENSDTTASETESQEETE